MKRPNKMGRIEADPKVKKQIPWNKIKKVAVVACLITLGVLGTLQFQKTVNDIKAQGVAEYRDGHCERFTNKEKTSSWLECDE